MLQRLRLKVTGDVQGIGFRYRSKEEAKRLGIFGWIQNKSDGTVEVVAEGEEKALQELVEFCKHGARGGHVSKIVDVWEEPTGEYEEFKIVY